jgi:hypothetical protein
VAVGPEFFEECNGGGIPHGLSPYTQRAKNRNSALKAHPARWLLRLRCI